MKKLEKRQIPHVIILAILSCAVFGYFAYRMITPSPASAANIQTAAVAATSKAKAATADPAAVDPTQVAPAPSAGMRDPFVPGVVDPAAIAAYRSADNKASAPPKPVQMASLPHLDPLPLPGGSGPAIDEVPARSVPTLPMPVAPASPTWTVTGIVQSGDGHMAILRSGEARRFVRVGDAVDSQFRVASVTRSSVTLAHGAERFILPLGGPKVQPAVKLESGTPAAPPPHS